MAPDTSEADALREQLFRAERERDELRRDNAVLYTMLRDLQHEHSDLLTRMHQQHDAERQWLLSRIAELSK
jgi:hypothetical protein